MFFLFYIRFFLPANHKLGAAVISENKYCIIKNLKLNRTDVHTKEIMNVYDGI